MNLERRLAASSVRRSLRDYSVYFATLAFCACLLYTYASCSDTITALWSEAAVASGSDTLNRATAFIAPLGFFSVVVFCLLARYANRFLVRRRKHELATLMLVGLSRGAVARVLLRECGLVALMALAAGMGVGVLLSPAFGALAAWAFALPWRLTIVVSLPGIAFAVTGFALVMLVSAIGAVHELVRTSLADLMLADRESEASVVRSRGAAARDFVVGIVCLGLGYSICLTVNYFIILMVPMIVFVCLGTYLVLRSLATVVGDLLRASRVVYLRDLTCFVSRQLEAHVSASCSALTCVAALLAVG
ncbi:MAG: FtsX-like permease family protein, partial [Olsenella sp.]